MNPFNILLLLCVTLSAYALQKSNPDSDFYNAAVVEFHQTRRNIFDSLTDDLEAYEIFIKDAKKQNVDIVVFPEGTLNAYKGAAIRVPPGSDKANPCTNATLSKILRTLSCAARNAEIYLVANVMDKLPCDQINCFSPDEFEFSTNVVFDRNGTIINRYRKSEMFRGLPDSKENGVFETDFGVKFAQVFNLDVMLRTNAVHMLVEDKISNVIMPHVWYSKLPFFTAVQIQETFAFTHNVNLLAAGANNPDTGSTGSGIYSGKNGRQVATMEGDKVTKMVVASLPKDVRKPIPVQSSDSLNSDSNDARNQFGSRSQLKSLDNLHLGQENIMMYRSQLLKIKEEQVVNLTHGEDGDDQYMYRAVAFDGVVRFSSKTLGVKNCAIVACTNDSLSSCARRFPDHSTVQQGFKIISIIITETVPKPMYNQTLLSDNVIYNPVTLDSSIMPLGIQTYKMDKVESEHTPAKLKLTLTLKSSQFKELLVFGILGRAYDKDGLAVSGSNFVYGSFTVILATLLLSYFSSRD